jgi:2-C-methyl-D-erythritol 4-phosphate cytidylyltransferase
MNLALIVAAGRGERMGVEGGKQFLTLLDKPVLAHTLIAFEQATLIDAMIVVTAHENYDKCLRIIDRYGISKADRVVIGGKERQDSVYNGLKAASDFKTPKLIAVHDGARPLIEPELIDRAIKSLLGCDGVVVGIPAKDTIKLVRDGFVTSTLDRAEAWQVQTPQVFNFEALLRAHELSRAQRFYGTDDSVLVERAGGGIKVIPGSEENIKITTPVDLVVAEALLRRRSELGKMQFPL